MHTTLAVATNGLPLGVLRAQCVAPERKSPEDQRPSWAVPIEEKARKVGVECVPGRKEKSGEIEHTCTPRQVRLVVGAIGVLMSVHKVTRQQAFDLLRIASQQTHRKLVDIATEVGDTGSLSLPRGGSIAESLALEPGDSPN